MKLKSFLRFLDLRWFRGLRLRPTLPIRRRSAGLRVEPLETRDLLAAPTLVYSAPPPAPVIEPADGSTLISAHPNIQVVFSERMEATAAQNKNNYLLFGTTGNSISIDSATLNAAGTVVTLAYNGGADLVVDTYTLFVRGDQLKDADEGLALSLPGQFAVANRGRNNVSVVNLPGDGTLGTLSDYALPSSDTATTATPIAAALGDLTGDMLPDLVVVNTNPAAVAPAGAQLAIFQGRSAAAGGGFSLTPDLLLDLPTGANNQDGSIVLGDFNKDTKLDIAVANFGTNNVRVFLNAASSGTLSFGTGTDFTTPAGPAGLVAGDFDADTNLDLAVALSTADANSNYNIGYLRGDGLGTFAAATTVAIGDSTAGTGVQAPRVLAAGSFNADPRTDLVVAGTSGGTLVLLNTTPVGNPTATFTTKSLTTTTLKSLATGVVRVPPAPTTLDDIVGLDATNKQALIFENTGGTTFTLQPALSTGTNPRGITLAHLNGDSRLDLVITQDNASGSVTVFENMSVVGSTSFSTLPGNPSYTVGGNPAAAVVGDTNENGTADIITINRTANTFSLLQGIGNGTFYREALYSTVPAPTTAIATGDLNGDGIKDLVILANSGSSSANVVSVRLGQPGGLYGPSVDYSPRFAGNTFNNLVSVAVGDISNDGKPDIVVVSSSEDEVGFLINNIGSATAPLGIGSFFAQQEIRLNNRRSPTQVVLGDFNNDKMLDIAVSNQGRSGGFGGGGGGGGSRSGVAVLLNVNGTFPNVDEYDQSVGEDVAIALGDFNRDNNLDFVIADGGGSGVVRLFTGDGKGNFSQLGGDIPLNITLQQYTNSKDKFGNPIYANQASMSVGDLNRDGFLDVVVASPSAELSGAGISVLLNQFGTGFAPALVTSVLPGTGLQTVTVANLNTDAFPDLVVTTIPSTSFATGLPGSTTANVFTLQGNGDGTFQPPIPFLAGGSGSPTLGPSYGVLVNDLPFVDVTTFRSGGTTVLANLIVNGSFEARDLNGVAGSLLGWKTFRLDESPGSHGMWSIQAGTTSPLSSTSVTPPTGVYRAMLDQQDYDYNFNGGAPPMSPPPGNPNADAIYSGTHVLYQDFHIPANATSARLSFSLSLNNEGTAWSDNTVPLALDWRTSADNQQVRVDIIEPLIFPPTGIDGASGVLQTIYITNIGDPLNSIVNRSNIDVSQWAGKTVRLRIAATNNRGKLIVGVDNVTVNAIFDDQIAPTLSNLRLRNPGFFNPADGGIIPHTTDSTLLGTVGDNGSLNNVAFIEFDLNNNGFGGPDDIKIATWDSRGDFTFTLPNQIPGLQTVGVQVVDVAGKSSKTTFTYYFQGPSLTEWQAYGPNTISTVGLPNIDYTSVSGRVTAIAVDPSDLSGNTYYIGSANGGIWKTTNGGSGWTPLTDNVFVDAAGNPVSPTTPGATAVPVPIGGLAISRSNPNILYAATGIGDQNFSSRPGFGVLKSVDGGKTWSLAGDSKTVLAGARATKVIIDTDNPDIAYVAVATGGISGPGVYKTVNGGLTWVNVLTPTAMRRASGALLPVGTPLMSVTDLIIDPFNTNRLLVGLGNIGFGGNPITAGVWRTTSKGGSWDQILGNDNATASPTLPDPNVATNIGRVTLAMGNGRVGDENISYVMYGTPPGNNTPPNVDYGRFLGLFKSSDNLLNFTQVMLKLDLGVGLPGHNFQNINVLGEDASNAGALVVDPANPNVVFVGGSRRNVDPGRPNPSLDQSFIRVDTGNMAFNGDDADKLAEGAARGGFYDGIVTALDPYRGEGVYWYNLEQGTSNQQGQLRLLPPSIRSLAFDAQGRLVIGTDSGIYRGVGFGYGYDETSGGSGILRQGGFGGGGSNFSTPGMTITAINGNLQISDLTSVAVDPVTRGVFYTTQFGSGAAGSNGVLNWTSQGLTGPTVSGTNVGINNAAAVRIATPPPGAPEGTPTTLFRVWQFADILALRPETSSDNGQTFNSINSTGIPIFSNPAGMFPGFVVNPTKIFDSGLFQDELLFGTNRVFQTRTSATVWDPISPVLSSVGGLITAMAIAPSQGGVYYVGTNLGELFVSLDSGGTWPSRNGGLPFQRINGITVDPSNHLIAYVMFGGGATGGHVFRTTNGGLTWVDISANLPSVPAYALVIVPDVVPTAPNGRLFVATDVGVFLSTTNGASWTRLGVGLPNVPVVDLQYNREFGVLAAATQGRGVFSLSIDNTGPRIESTAIDTTGTTLTGITFTFDEPINPNTLTLSELTVTGPFGTIVPLSIINLDPAVNESFMVTFAPQSTFGSYYLTVGPNVADFVANKMDQNQNGQQGETPGDIFSGRVYFQVGTNSAPVLNTTVVTFPPVRQDDLTNQGTDLATWVATLPITDADANAAKGIAITAVDNTNGTWQFSTNGGANWTVITGVTDLNALVLEAKTTTRLRFVPTVNYIGPSTFRFRAWDLTSGLQVPSGADGGFTDASASGGSFAFSTVSATANLAVLPVNHAPSFTPGLGQTVLENAPLQTVVGWATNLDKGPGAESSQNLTFLVSNNNNALFAVQPTISANGTLTYQPAPFANGTATVTVILKDDGGTVNGGVDSSTPITFIITVIPVNQPPIFTGGPNQFVQVFGGFQQVVGWASNILGGPSADEAGQQVTFLVTTNNPSLFIVQPTISANGTLTYQPGRTVGTATVTVIAQDNGGTANGGSNTSAAFTFTIFVEPIISSGSADTVWIAQIYRDLLGREISVAEANNWVAVLEAGASRLDVVNNITRSDEYRINVMQGLFKSYLGRSLDAGGTSYFLGLFRNGATLDEVKAEIFKSDEYYLKNGNTNYGLLFGLYRDALGMTLDESGRVFWGTKLAQGESRRDVALGILKSEAADSRMIQLAYLDMLRRNADGGGLNFWLNNLQQGTREESMFAGMTSSPEYSFNSAVRYDSGPDIKWLNQVFKDVLGRDVDQVGITFHTNLIRSGARRHEVALGIMNSPEYRATTARAAFVSVLHRAPDAGTVEFYSNLLASGKTVEQIKANMFDSAEYYFAQGGGTNLGFLQALYRDVLGQPLDQTGLQEWGTRLANGETRESVALGVLTSPNAFRILVRAGYPQYLRRQAEEGGVNFWVDALLNGLRDEEFYAKLLGSTEYYRKFSV